MIPEFYLITSRRHLPVANLPFPIDLTGDSFMLIIIV